MINEEGRHSNTVINDALEKYSDASPRDKALFVRLVHGTLEYQIRIDYVIDLFSKVRTSAMRPLIRNLLRLSVYQMMFTDKIPDSAVCDEAVKIVKKTSLRNLSGFVNGVLRNIARSRKDITVNDKSIMYSVPEWLRNLLCETIGEENCDRFLEYSLVSHGVSVRRIGTDDVYILEDASGLTELPEWKSGEIIVQDYSASLPVIMGDIKKGQVVLDVCASPGGKSIQAAEKTGIDGKVISCDISEKKAEKIRENIARTGIRNVEIRIQDAAKRDDSLIESADVVIADCPCSGIGTVSKKPEIKNRLSLKDCMALAGIQSDILNNVCDYVKPCGRLIYSTCTLDHFENEDNIKKFLSLHPEFSLVEEKTMIPSVSSDRPFDGFYIAVLVKND